MSSLLLSGEASHYKLVYNTGHSIYNTVYLETLVAN